MISNGPFLKWISMPHKISICWPNSIFISQNHFWNILERLLYHSLFELLRFLWVVAWICSMDCNMLISNCSTLSKDSGFPLRLDYNFQHWTERPVLITDQPYISIFFQTLTKILQWAYKNRAFSRFRVNFWGQIFT